MAATKAPSLVMAKLTSLFLLIALHLGCFFITPAAKRRRQTQTDNDDDDTNQNDTETKTTKRKKIWSYLRGIVSTAYNFSCKPSAAAQTHPSTSTPPQHSSAVPSPEKVHRKRPSLTESELVVNDTSDNNNNSHCDQDLIFPPLRNDIFPCPLCGEIFHKPQSMEAHQATKHAVSELLDADSGKNIVRIIFKTGWNKSKLSSDRAKSSPAIHRILKIHNGSKILSRFEEHREAVKSRAAARSRVSAAEERCVADGNEHLRFHCSTFVCDLGRNGSSGVCGHQYCGVCGIIKSGFSAKLDGIPTMSSSWRAHASVPEDVEEEFKFMNVKRAMLVCRVVAGRVGSEGEGEDEKESGGFDSVLGRAGCGAHARVDEEELLVFNPRAVLPCFVIVYTV